MTKDSEIANFQATVWQHFKRFGRHELPWRIPELDGSFDPYKILVSEVMLQQTQVQRVIPKYFEFLAAFPSAAALSVASLGEVLIVWNGLGYNRRAKFLWQAAGKIGELYQGVIPQDTAELIALPGVGKNTAAAIQAYAFNLPELFIETNIRTVYIYHFFHEQKQVTDQAVLAMLGKTIDRKDPRLWYWALMDYGSFLKQTIGNLNKLSQSYVKQSSFEGSRRQIRGAVIRTLAGGPLTLAELSTQIDDERLSMVLNDLIREGLVKKNAGRFALR